MRRLPAARRRAMAVAWLAALVAGCGGPGPSATAAPGVPAGLPPEHVLLVVEEAAGWPSMQGQFDPRTVTLSADGTLVASRRGGATILDLVATRLSPEAIDDAWALVQGAGLAVDRQLPLEGLFDAGTTLFRTDDGSRSAALAIYALGVADSPAWTFPPDEALLRANASSAIAELVALAGDDPWTPPAVLLWSARADPAAAAPQRLPWTPAIDLATAGQAAGLPVSPVWSRCVLVEGPQAAEVAAVARELRYDGVVVQDGLAYSLFVRPVYPDELGSVACPTGG